MVSSNVVLFLCLELVCSHALASESKLSNFVSTNQELEASASAYAKVGKRDDEPKFSIGLGTLSPSYSQKLGPDGRTKLDFSQEKNGFSYSVSNVNHHSLQTGESGNSVTKEIDPNLKNHNYGAMGYFQSGQPNVNIYHQQGGGLGPFPVPMNAYGSNYGPSNGQVNIASNMMPFPYGQFASAYPAASNYFGTYGTSDNSQQNQQKSVVKSDTSSTTASNSQTLPGGMFNYGLSQNHGLPMSNSMANPMNFNYYPYAASTPAPTPSTTSSPTHSPTPNPIFPFSGFGFDPFSVLGGPSGGFGSGYEGYGMNSNINSPNSMSNMGASGQASSPYSYYSSMYPGMMGF